MKLQGLVLTLLFIAYNGLYSQEINREKTDSVLSARGEAFIAIPNSGLKTIQIIPDGMIFDRYTDTLTYFYINRASFKQLEESGLEYFYITPPSLAGNVVMAQSAAEVLAGSGYPTYQQYLEIMDSFRTMYPSICRIDTIGYSVNGRLILSARLHPGDFLQGERPVMMYSSTMHGDEPAGYVLMLMLLDEMLEGYGKDESFTELFDNTVILINPLSNPDGTYYLGDTTIYGAIRMNSNYADLNRDFPDCRISLFYSFDGRQKETVEMMKYLEKYKPSISANFHGGAELVNYPWDSKWMDRNNQKVIKYHPDNNWFVSSGKEYVDSARRINPDYMKTDFEEGYVMGVNWYDITGGRQDYVTYFLRGHEVSIELSSDKMPSSSELSGLYNMNRISLKNYLRLGLLGLYGEVRDSISNIPVRAKIFMPSHDSLNSFVYSDPETGRFFRYLPHGLYDLWVEADGYLTEIMKDINIEDNKRTHIDIRLKSVKSLLKDEDIIIFPNPFSAVFTFLFHSETPEDKEVLIYNMNGNKIYSSGFISSPGVNYKTIDLADHPSGIYFLRLIAAKSITTVKIIKVE